MQKLVNAVAIASGVVSLAVVGLGGYVFIRKDAIIEDAKTKILEQVTGGLGGALVPDGLGGGGLDIPSLSPTPSGTMRDKTCCNLRCVN